MTVNFRSPGRTLFIILMFLPNTSIGDGFEKHTWPGEGIPILVASQNVLRLSAEPRISAKRKVISYQQGWRIPFKDTLLRTIQSTTIRVEEHGTVNLWCDGSVEYNFDQGETIEYLQYRAEGYITAKVDGRVCELPLYHEQEVFGRQFDEPIVEWWVQVEYRDGSSPGWLLVDESQNTFADREF